MAIYYKRDIEKRLEALDEHYEKLRSVLQGREPMKGYASAFGIDEKAFNESRVSVDFPEVQLQLDHFKSELAAIKALKGTAEKPLK
jgi:hypothetical protein